LITTTSQAEEAKKKEEADQKNAMKVCSDYSPEDFNTALAKVTEAAIRYDK